MRRHKQNGSCTQHRNIICRKCKAVCTNQADLRKHIKDDHEDEKSREVCKHWKAGNCFKGDQCKFAHVGYRNVQDISSTRRESIAPCRNGSSCAWLERGRCKFEHSRQSNQGDRQYGIRQNGNQIGSQQMCWQNQNCRRNSCPYKHTTMSDFPSLRTNQRQRNQAWKNGRQ